MLIANDVLVLIALPKRCTSCVAQDIDVPGPSRFEFRYCRTKRASARRLVRHFGEWPKWWQIKVGVDNNNAVKVIRHNHECVERHVWVMLGDCQSALFDNVAIGANRQLKYISRKDAKPQSWKYIRP